jgi:hypothetical protein
MASLRKAGDCAQSYCNNRGTCEINDEEKSGYLCHCSTGWSGKNCETSKLLLIYITCLII